MNRDESKSKSATQRSRGTEKRRKDVTQGRKGAKMQRGLEKRYCGRRRKKRRRSGCCKESNEYRAMSNEGRIVPGSKLQVLSTEYRVLSAEGRGARCYVRSQRNGWLATGD
jgi:hypothetical protein